MLADGLTKGSIDRVSLVLATYIGEWVLSGLAPVLYQELGVP